MTKYSLKQVSIALGAVSIFFIIRAFFWLQDLVNNDFFEGMSHQDIFAFAMRDGGYFGAFEQMLVGTVIILLTIDFVLPKDESVYLVRYVERTEYIKSRCLLIFLICSCIVCCKYVVAFLMLYFQFENQLIFSYFSAKRFLSGVLIQLIYSIRCGVIYMIFRDILNKRIIATGITVLIYFWEYYIWVDNLLGIAAKIKWMPYLDLSAAFSFASGEINGIAFFLTVLRQFGLLLICTLVWMRYWRIKDVMNVEN